MAIITDNPNYEGHEFTWQYQDFSWHRDDAVCFFCDKKLTFPYVAWTGSGNALDKKDGNASWLFLHPDCAISLMLRLSRDLHSIEHMQRKPEGDPHAKKHPLYPDHVMESDKSE